MSCSASSGSLVSLICCPTFYDRVTSRRFRLYLDFYDPDTYAGISRSAADAAVADAVATVKGYMDRLLEETGISLLTASSIEYLLTGQRTVPSYEAFMAAASVSAAGGGNRANSGLTYGVYNYLPAFYPNQFHNGLVDLYVGIISRAAAETFCVGDSVYYGPTETGENCAPVGPAKYAVVGYPATGGAESSSWDGSGYWYTRGAVRFGVTSAERLYGCCSGTAALLDPQGNALTDDQGQIITFEP